MSFIHGHLAGTSSGISLARNAFVLLVGMSFAARPTAAGASLVDLGQVQPRVSRTTGRVEILVARPVANCAGRIHQLRRLTGLSWEQLARMLRTSRRSVHNWANGEAMAPVNEEKLSRTLAVIQRLDRGSVHANRDLLMSPLDDGKILVDRFAAGDLEGVLAAVGLPGTARAERRHVDRPVQVQPIEVATLLDARNDRVHEKDGRPLRARRVWKSPGE